MHSVGFAPDTPLLAAVADALGFQLVTASTCKPTDPGASLLAPIPDRITFSVDFWPFRLSTPTALPCVTGSDFRSPATCLCGLAGLARASRMPQAGVGPFVQHPVVGLAFPH